MGIIPESELVRYMAALNPWWINAPTDVPAVRRIAFRECRRHLLNEKLRRAVLLSGPRRVGKSVILRQIALDLINNEIASPRAVLYLDLGLPQFKLSTIQELLQLYHESFHPAGERAFLLLDEVQFSEDWHLQLKALVDHSPQYRILATGSTSFTQEDGLIDSGVGRFVTVLIPTLSFYEFMSIRQEHVPDETRGASLTPLFKRSRAELGLFAQKFKPLRPLFEHYLLVGGFPETAKNDNLETCQRLLREDIVDRVLKRDMTSFYNIRSAADLERVFIYLCYHIGGAVSVTKCASELGVNRQTVDNYLDHLESANLIYRLPPDKTGGKTALKQRNKYYVVDAALRNAVLLKGESVLRDDLELGFIVESTVLRHLIAFHYRQKPHIGYWTGGKATSEVDIVVRQPGELPVPFEVKYRSKAQLADAPGLVEFARLEGASAPERAYLVTRHDADFEVTSLDELPIKVLRIPAHIFTCLLGSAEQHTS